MSISQSMFLDKVTDMICRVNTQHQVNFISKTGLTWLNEEHSDVTNFLALVHKDDHLLYQSHVKDLQNSEHSRCELRLIRNGEPNWVELTLIKIPKTDQITICVKDISSWKANEQVLQFASEHDALTHLGNRVLLKRIIVDFISLSKKTNVGFAFLVLDLDGFKKVNDSLGHQAGDEVLVETARRLNLNIRGTDIAIRLGGDEFVVLLNGVHDTVSLVTATSKIIKSIHTPYVLSDNKTAYLSTSVGVSLYPDHGIDYDLLMRNADIAMYDAKKNGKNQYSIYREETFDDTKITLESSMYGGIREGEFYLVYQPQFLPDGKTLVGVEALMRWKSDTYGEVSPASFIPIAEENGLIGYLGAWALRTSCYYIAQLNQKYPNLTMSINVSSRQLQSENFLKTLKKILDETKVSPKNIVLEITESLLMQKPEEVSILLNSISNMGIKIAVDDFGTGYSSLSYLSKFPLSALKVDKVFIDNVCTNKQDQIITTAIIGLAHGLDMYSVVEGVESQEQLDFICEKGGKIIQGYIFSKPLLPNELEQKISDLSKYNTNNLL